MNGISRAEARPSLTADRARATTPVAALMDPLEEGVQDAADQVRRFIVDLASGQGCKCARHAHNKIVRLRKREKRRRALPCSLEKIHYLVMRV